MGGSGGLERTDFEQLILWEGVVVLKELIFNSFYFGTVAVVLKELIFEKFLLWDSAVVLIELILNNLILLGVWWS